MTLLEFLVVLAVVGVLVIFLIPCMATSASLRRGQMMQTLSNMKQLHLSTQQMALERSTNGMLGEVICPKGLPITFAQWTNQLVGGGYLDAGDVAKMLATPGAAVGINAFAVRMRDTNALFLATKNWHGIASKQLSGLPYEAAGFVVFRTSGDGAVLTDRSINDTNTIGGGGTFNYLPLK